MSLLDKLWDETLAGPTPESGLGKLRKHNSFSAAARTVAAPPPCVVPPSSDVPISRSITAPRDIPQRNLRVSVDSSSDPSSPSGDPSSPFSPSTPGGNFKRWARRKSTAEALPNSYSKSPTGYDWIVLSALER